MMNCSYAWPWCLQSGPSLQGPSTSPLLALGRFFFRFVAIGLIFAGLFALVQSAAGRFLQHDLRYVGMSSVQLCGLDQGRVARFMIHDRVSFGGALIALGCLYLWLELFPLKGGEAWGWWTFLFSGLAGFGSFLAFLGYGYLDVWHGLATLFLLPFYVGALALTSRVILHRGGRAVPAHQPARRLEHAHLGRMLLLAMSAGLILGGTTILLVGMTRVFVSEDVSYLQLGASDLLALNRRLLPLIAHDRAAFGGAIATCGILFFLCIRFGQPSPSLWCAVFVAGAIGFLTAIGIHPLIGYIKFSHLAPAYLGAVMFSLGICFSYKPMCGSGGERAARSAALVYTYS